MGFSSLIFLKLQTSSKETKSLLLGMVSALGRIKSLMLYLYLSEREGTLKQNNNCRTQT
jgi:hypothetical protein